MSSDHVPQYRRRPHEKATTVAPMFHIMLEPLMCCLAPAIAYCTRVRWMLAHPLEIRIVPKFIPVIPLPYLRDISYITIRDLLFVLPLLLLLFYGAHYSYIKPDLDFSGQLASYAVYLTFLTATKSNNLLSLLFGIPFERLISLHFLCSLVAVVMGCLHTYAAYQYGGANMPVSIGQEPTQDSVHASFGTEPNLVKFLWDGKTNITGSLLVLAMTSMIVLSVLPIRRVAFQLWLSSHILLACTALIVCFLHNVTTVVFVMLWWVLDLSIRYMLMAGFRYHAATATLEIVHNMRSKDGVAGIVQLTLPKPDGFDYSPGQFVQLAVPAISFVQYHPISISSAPHEETVTFHIRALGDWTDRLVELASTKQEITVMIEGPYGALSIDMDDLHRYKTVLLVGGGIGHTHCDSVGKALLHDHEHHGRPLTNLRYVWAVRNKAVVDDLPPALGGHQGGAHAAGTVSDYSPLQRSTHGTVVADDSTTMSVPPLQPRPAKVQIDVYCTRDDIEDANGSVKNDDSNTRYQLGIRPDLDEILDEMKQLALAHGETNVAVIGCGPGGMMDALRDACRYHSSSIVGCTNTKDLVYFDFHTERFEF